MKRSSVHPAIAILFFVATLFVSRAAVADVVYPMEGSWCVPEMGNDVGGQDDLARITYQGVNGHSAITNISQSTVHVHCPIVKYTSGPNVTNDRLNQVSVTFAGNATGTCFVNVWQMSAASWWGDNGPTLWDAQSVSLNGAGTYVVYTGQSWSTSGYWGDDQTWFYADLACNLSAQASLTTFTVDEAGTRQNRLMFPSAMCVQYNNSASFNYNAGSGGFLESTGNNGGGFQFGCPLYPNGATHIQIMVGPSIANNNAPTLGCYLMSSPNTTWQTVQQNSGQQDFPARVLSFSRATASSNDYLSCGLWSNGSIVSNGDGKIMSYRVW